jgi:hypothetical protein
MKEKRIAIYGGTDLDAASQEFVRFLAQAILRSSDDIVVMTGGFRANPKKPQSVSTDSQVVKGIEDLPGIQPSAVNKRLSILQPDPVKDRADALRYRPEETHAAIVTLDGTTARQRRFKLVTAATAIVTVKGVVHTSMVLDTALAVGRPFLPLPFTGGDSREYWDDCKEQICGWFRIPAEVAAQMESVNLPRSTEAERRRLADLIAGILARAIERVCLLALPFHARYRQFYQEVIEPAITAAGYTPRRLDEIMYSGRVLSEYFRGLHDCDRVIADVTDYNPNVMYEIGYAHSLNIFPLLIDATPVGDQLGRDLPFYLKDHVVYRYDGTEQGGTTLAEMIRSWLSIDPNSGDRPG